ncbi:hypothetical protein M8542_19720 [Amycolatopsis sp. OK19-0408]|uniref:Uncharacterized protein n=1 Tax=Amycolatopsis iheyensis TaxID=2945988 RepID=A0A9X2NDW3_9PSEU|nr:hypothetical protein [Amycolatopsis iheyensis]MCR6485060.1 hypothetical protein [Amycolatopsis iheyensis]
MAAPVTTKGSFGCRHDGTASPTASDPRLTIGGEQVVLFESVTAFGPYDKCGAPNPPGVCVATAVLLPNPGRSRLLTVGTSPVLLDSVQATSTPAAVPLKSVAAGNSVLTAS